MDNLVHGVRQPYEDERLAHRGGIRQLGHNEFGQNTIGEGAGTSLNDVLVEIDV